MKKLVLFALLLLSAFTLTGCEKEDLTELHGAIDKSGEITNAKITVRSEAMGMEIEVVEYLTEDAIMIIMGETLFTEEITMYGKIEEDKVYMISQDLFFDDTPYQVTEIVSLDEYVEDLGGYDVFKEGDFKKEGDYYIAEDISFDLEGYEEVEEFTEVKVQIKDGYLYSISMTMEIQGFEVTASVTIEDIGEVSVTLPKYFEMDELSNYMDQLSSFGYDFSFYSDRMEIITQDSFFEYRGASVFQIDTSVGDLAYNTDTEQFIYNNEVFEYDEFLNGENSPWTLEGFNVIKELIEFYK